MAKKPEKGKGKGDEVESEVLVIESNDKVDYAAQLKGALDKMLAEKGDLLAFKHSLAMVASLPGYAAVIAYTRKVKDAIDEGDEG